MKKVHIIGGGTLNYIDSHLALCAPAFGTTARMLDGLCKKQGDKLEVVLHLTRMAGGELNTVHDVARLMQSIKNDPDTKIVFLPVAIADFQAIQGERAVASNLWSYGSKIMDKDTPRLSTHSLDYKNRDTWPHLLLRPGGKLIGHMRRGRKDIYLVGFKQTDGATPEEQYVAGLNLLKGASCNLVLANDTKTHLNMVITPEEAKYHVTTDRVTALKGLVEMAYLRSHLTFTRSTVVEGESILWDSDLVPASLRAVVDYCIQKGAYKPFRGATVGHFACKVDDTTFLTSKRKTNFNDLEANGLVKVTTDGPDSVIAYGSKPSVGGQSQRIVFTEHQDYDCIVHFHCPIKPGSPVPQVSQREYECGSHECGRNTSRGLAKFGNLSAVYLTEHGPNIVFNRSIDPQEVISFIEANFDLNEKTGGPVSLGQILKTPDTLESLMELG
jgi:hypothetical protein